MDIALKLDRLLLQVEKPGRYAGGEWNSVVKDWDAVETKVVLAFPDLYDLGMANLGLMILYDILNREPQVLAERTYAPWPDMESLMRREGIPLYSLETRHPVTDFDIIGFSLPYEQLYSNVLNMLDMAGIPLFSAERDARWPLIIAGGSAAYNPEPMADFIDFFVVGEGEEVILEIVREYQAWKRESRDVLNTAGETSAFGEARDKLLRRMALIPGVYVPRFYRPWYLDNGTLGGVEPLVPEAPPVVTKRIVPVLPPPVTRLIVPFVDVVHDRAAVEIQRGCTRGCRFCQAGMVYRPVRERPLGEILAAVDAIVEETGYEEVALLSLSSSDHSRIGDLVQEIVARHGDDHLNVSLPSLRIESFSVGLADMLKDGRRSGFTFAPEAATERMRNVINKAIPDHDLLQVTDEVYGRGWRTIKLYFMIGQPGETLDDVHAIASLAKRVYDIGRRHHGRAAKVRVGVSTFVPKPHTPFQWMPLDDLESIRQKQMVLRRSLSGKGITYNWNDPQETLLEAAFSRGDRRLGRVIWRAWQKGVRFDGWNDHLKPGSWWEAFAEEGLDPYFFASRCRPADEVFPWDHINVGVKKEWLLRDYQASLEEKTLADCRERCFACGILATFKGIRAQTPPEAWECPPVRRPAVVESAD